MDFAEKVATYFLQKRANPNLPTESDGLTPLHIACIWGRTDIVKLLLNHGADLELKCNEGQTPTQYAIAENNYQVIEAIQEFVFEQKINKKKKELILKSCNLNNNNPAVVTSNEYLGTPIRNLHLKNALQHLEEKKFTPNRINYNFDATSPYYVNITHRRHKKSHEESTTAENKENDYEDTSNQKNLFELTEDNLKEFSKKMAQVIVIDRLAIHKRRSYIQNWREKILQIRESDLNSDVSYVQYLKSYKLIQPKDNCLKSSQESDKEEIKTSDESYVTARNEKKYDNTSTSSISTKLTLPNLDYDTDALRNELIKLNGGIKPGPINSSTKRLYLKQLVKLQKKPELVPSNKVQSSKLSILF